MLLGSLGCVRAQRRILLWVGVRVFQRETHPDAVESEFKGSRVKAIG